MSLYFPSFAFSSRHIRRSSMIKWGNVTPRAYVTLDEPNHSSVTIQTYGILITQTPSEQSDYTNQMAEPEGKIHIS